jgi:hypothetical protein
VAFLAAGFYADKLQIAGSPAMIRNGVQAVLICNGLFTWHRSIEQVFAQELAYLRRPVGNVNGGQPRPVVPSRELVIVRRGLDYGKQGFNRWDLTREVLKAVNRSPQ